MKNFNFLFVLSCLLFGSTNFIQAQSNIDCDNAMVIHCGDMIVGNNSAVPAVSTPDCLNGPSDTWDLNAMWYKIIGDGSTISISLCNSVTDFNSYIQLLDGDCASLACVASDTAANGLCGASFPNGSLIGAIVTVPGQVYYLIVSGYNTGDVGNFRVDMSCSNTPPPNEVQVSGNGPICEGDDAIFDITPSSPSDPTPAGIVYYEIDGVAGDVYLDENGEATITVTGATSDTEMELIEIRNQFNLFPLALGASVTVVVNPLPEITLFEITPDPGCAGQGITLTVNGTPNASFIFSEDGNQLSFSLDNSGIFVLNVPGDEGMYDYDMLEVSLNGCTTNYSGEFAFSYTTNPTPEITSYTILPSTICEGDEVTLLIQGTPNAVLTLVNPVGDVGGGTLDASGEWGITGPLGWGNGTHTWFATGIELNGCSQTYTTEFEVMVTQNPIPEVTSITNNNPACHPGSIEWYFEGTPGANVTFDIPNVFSSNVTLDAAGNATFSTGSITDDITNSPLTLTVTGISLNGCEGDVTGLSSSLSVFETPEITSFSISPSTACPDEIVTYMVTGTPNATITTTLPNGNELTFPLDASGEFMSSDLASNYTGVSPGLNTWTITKVELNGCSTDYTTEFQATLTYNEIPEVTSITAANNPICFGSSLVWNIDVTSGASYSWQLKDASDDSVVTSGGPTTSSIISVNASSVGSLGDYYLVLTNVSLNGCVAPGPFVGETINYQEVPEITSFTILPSTICEGDPVTFLIQGTPNAELTFVGPIGDVYNAILDASGEWTLTGTLFYGNGTHTFTIVEIELNGCSTSYTTEFEATVTQNPRPVVTSITNNNPACHPGSIEWYFEGTPGASVSFEILNVTIGSVLLDASGNAIAELSTIASDITNSPLTLTVTGISLNGCEGFTGASSSVSVYETPEITSFSISPSTACPDDWVTYTVTGTPNATITSTSPSGDVTTFPLDASGEYISSGVASNITGISPGLNTWTITKVELNGCSTDYTTEFQATLMYNEYPTVNSIPAFMNPSCSGSSMIWNPDISPGASYEWEVKGASDDIVYFSGGPTMAGDITIISPPIGSYYVELINVTLNTCVAAGPFVGETIDYRETPEMTSFTILPSTICQGDQVTFLIQGTPNATVKVISPNGIPSSLPLNASGEYTLTGGLYFGNGTHTWTIVEIELNGCSTSYTTEFEATVTQNPIPEVTSITNNSSVCHPGIFEWYFEGTPGALVQFDIPETGLNGQAVTLDASGEATYSNITIGSDPASSPLVLTVSSISLNGCDGDVTGLSSSLTVFDTPEITSYSISPTEACEDELVTFTITGTPLAMVTETAPDGTGFTHTLDATGELIFTGLASDYGGSVGSNTWTITNVTLNGCSSDYTTEFAPSLTVNVCEYDCYDFMVRNADPEEAELYETQSYITSTSTIENVGAGGAVTYSSQEITLNGGFEVKIGTEFDAVIGGCVADNACGTLMSPTSTAQAEGEIVRWNGIENATCITELVQDNGDTTPDVEVNVGNFISGSSGPVSVVLSIGGVSNPPITVSAGQSTEYIGVFTAANGTSYSTSVNIDYDGVEFLQATIVMLPQ